MPNPGYLPARCVECVCFSGEQSLRVRACPPMAKSTDDEHPRMLQVHPGSLDVSPGWSITWMVHTGESVTFPLPPSSHLTAGAI